MQRKNQQTRQEQKEEQCLRSDRVDRPLKQCRY